MSVAYQSTQTSSSAVGSVICNKPTGTVQGDLLIAQFSLAGVTGRTLTPPSGWTQIASESRGGASGPQSALYMKVAGASEPSTYTFAYSSTQNVAAVVAISRFTGPNLTTQVNASNGNVGGQSTTATTTGLTPSANSMICVFAASNTLASGNYSGWSIATSDPGLVERYDSTGGSDGNSIGMACALRPESTATGASSVTLTSSFWTTHIIAISSGDDVTFSAPLLVMVLRALMFPFNAPRLTARLELLTQSIGIFRNAQKRSASWLNKPKS